jgi:hypothetical protein
MLFASAAKLPDQIGEDGDVDEEDQDFSLGQVAMNLPEFEGDERSGKDGGEIFRPALAECQAGAFGKGEASVKEGANAEFFELVVIHIRETSEKVMDEEVAGIDPESIDPMEHVGGNVLMQKPQCADSHGEENQALYKFESGDN